MLNFCRPRDGPPPPRGRDPMPPPNRGPPRGPPEPRRGPPPPDRYCNCLFDVEVVVCKKSCLDFKINAVMLEFCHEKITLYTVQMK